LCYKFNPDTLTGEVEKTSYFLASKIVRDTTKLTTNDKQEIVYALSIGTKVDDLG